jgi:hypothetical protein
MPNDSLTESPDQDLFVLREDFEEWYITAYCGHGAPASAIHDALTRLRTDKVINWTPGVGKPGYLQTGFPVSPFQGAWEAWLAGRESK